MDAAAAASAIELADLQVRYGRVAAVDGVSLEVAPGAVYALLGRNGSGKSSLVRCLLGQRRPDAGRVAMLGSDPWRERRRLMAEVGVVPEDPDAPPGMTVAQLVRFVARLAARWDDTAVAQRLASFAVPLEVPFARLSRGQRTQVMLALALGHRPRLLVLDDPSLGLDAVARREVFAELIGDLADRGTTVFVTSHDLTAIEGLADRVGFLVAGRLVLDEPLETLKGRFRRLIYARAADDPGAGSGSPAEEIVGAMEPLVLVPRGRQVEAVVSRFDPGAIERLRATGAAPVEVRPTALEEIFVAVAGRETEAPR